MIKSLEIQWVRSVSNRVFGGVCGGIARALNLDPWLVRFLWVVSVFLFGLGIGFYILCLIAFPREDRKEQALNKMVLGVCARLHKRGDIEVGLARLIALLLLIGSAGAAVVGYIILNFILEEKQTSPLS